MSLVEAPAALSPVEEMTAMSEKRLSALGAPGSKPEAKPAESVVGKAPEGTAPTKESATKGPAAKPGSPEPAPKAKPSEDHADVPEKYRAFVESAPEEFRAWLGVKLGEGKLQTVDYTLKTTAVADEKRALLLRKGHADFGEAIEQDPEAMTALRALRAKREGKPVPEPKKFDWSRASDEEVEAHLAERDKRTEERVIRSIHGEREVETQEDTERRLVATAALAAFIDKDDPEEAKKSRAAEVDSTFDDLGGFPGLRAMAQAKGEVFSSDFVVATLRRFVPPKKESAKPKTQDSPNANGASRGAPAGASALSRAAGTSPSLSLPQFMREGREPTTRNERIAESIAYVNQRRVAKGLPPLTSS